MLTPELATVAQRQGGAFTLDQWRGAGLTLAELRTARRRGHVVRILHEAYAASTTPDTLDLREHAALLRYGDLSCLSHENAGWRRRLVLTAPITVTVTIPETHRVAAGPDWLIVIRSRDVAPEQVGTVRVSSLARTVCDLGATRTLKDLSAIALKEIQAKRLTLAELIGVVARGGTRAGMGVARDLVEDLDPRLESGLTGEPLELAKIATPLELIPGFELAIGSSMLPLDIAAVSLRIDLEADGWATHGTQQGRARDNRRDERLRRAGWVVLRSTTYEIRYEPRKVVAIIRRAIEERIVELAT